VARLRKWQWDDYRIVIATKWSPKLVKLCYSELFHSMSPNFSLGGLLQVIYQRDCRLVLVSREDFTQWHLDLGLIESERPCWWHSSMDASELDEVGTWPTTRKPQESFSQTVHSYKSMRKQIISGIMEGQLYIADWTGKDSRTPKVLSRDTCTNF
jgi:hypothetical protein